MLAAHRDDHPQFEPARTWLDGLLESGKPFAVTGLVAGSFVRLATNRRIFLTPTPVEDAFAYLRALRDQPGHLTLSPGPGHLELFERSCRTADAMGDLAPDAQLAAIAVEHGGELISFDRDFARFADVRWARP
ncbi:MAG TPA: type II toxin-antitoxin system VapC family toxin [Solirubrobacteraceae bacterium]|nr:type II toxin-antitoxin system VapC family toxin [Solirubrobacteraceae bacterium]